MEDSKDKEGERNNKILPYPHRFGFGRRSEQRGSETVLPCLTVLDARKLKLVYLWKREHKYVRTYKGDPQATLPISMQEPEGFVNGR